MSRLVYWRNNETPLNATNLNELRNLIVDLIDEYDSNYNELKSTHTTDIRDLKIALLTDSSYILKILNLPINTALRAGYDGYHILYDKYGFPIESYREDMSTYPETTYVHREGKENVEPPQIETGVEE